MAVAVTAVAVATWVAAVIAVEAFRTVVPSVADFTVEAATLRRCDRLHHRADIMLPRHLVQALRVIRHHRLVRLRRLTRLHPHT